MASSYAARSSGLSVSRGTRARPSDVGAGEACKVRGLWVGELYNVPFLLDIIILTGRLEARDFFALLADLIPPGR